MILDHGQLPGPDYWSWRCLRCGEAVSKHAKWWQGVFVRKAADSGTGGDS